MNQTESEMYGASEATEEQISTCLQSNQHITHVGLPREQSWEGAGLA